MQGWNLATSDAKLDWPSASEIDKQIKLRIEGELQVSSAQSLTMSLTNQQQHSTHSHPMIKFAAVVKIELERILVTSIVAFLASVPGSCLVTSILASLQFLDGATLLGLQSLNKPVRESLQRETHVLSVEKPRFIHGSGLGGSS